MTMRWTASNEFHPLVVTHDILIPSADVRVDDAPLHDDRSLTERQPQSCSEFKCRRSGFDRGARPTELFTSIGSRTMISPGRSPRSTFAPRLVFSGDVIRGGI